MDEWYQEYPSAMSSPFGKLADCVCSDSISHQKTEKLEKALLSKGPGGLLDGRLGTGQARRRSGSLDGLTSLVSESPVSSMAWHGPAWNAVIVSRRNRPSLSSLLCSRIADARHEG